MRLLYRDDIHTYFYEDQPDLKLTSVSKVLDAYHEKFDREGISKKTAEKKGISQEELLAQWDLAGKIARDKGTKIHAIKEAQYHTLPNVVKHPIEGEYKIGLDLDNLNPGIYPEIILDHPFYNLVGTSDFVEIFEDNSFNLSDFKTNAKLEFESFKVYDPVTHQRFHKMMFTPVNHLMDCEGVRYSLQLSLYAFFLEERGYTPRDLWIDHIIFDENDEEINIVKYPINYLRKEAKAICEHFKQHNK